MIEVEKLKPNILEFLAVVLAGVIHIALELIWGHMVSGWFSVFAVALFIAYISYRAYNNTGIFRSWGFRLDNIRGSLKAYGLVILVGTVLLFIVGLLKGSITFSVGMFYSALIYTLWGIAQQFVLQNYLAVNIEKYFKSPVVQAFLVSLLFASSHYPRLLLAGYSFLAGFLLVLAYRHHRNIYLAGISHGVLATFLFYWAFEFNLSDWFSEIFVGLIG